MEWTVDYQAEHRILFVKTEGVADRQSILGMIQTIKERMEAHQVGRCLIDHRAITAVQGGTGEIYNHVEEIIKKSRRSFQLAYAIKIVEVIRPEHEDHFRFLETVFRNRGFEFTVVHDYDAALRLLIQ